MTREDAIHYVEENILDKNNRDILEILIPELKESEDERIRKWLIGYFNQLVIDGIPVTFGNGLNVKDIIAWIEKQGKCKTINVDEMVSKYAKTEEGAFGLPVNCQIRAYRQGINDVLNLIVLKDEILKKKSNNEADNTNKVKPKFKIGDWITCDNLNTVLILSVKTDKYLVETIRGTIDFPSIDFIDRQFRLWTLQDAKDGDILVSNYDPFIFKGLLDPKNPGCPVGYCGLDCDDIFIVGSGTNDESNCWSSNEEIKPATKEQCKHLFQKMKEAGYLWDNDNKKLIDFNKQNE